MFSSRARLVSIGAKDLTELKECQYKRRAVNCHAEIPIVIVITRTTDSYVIQSAGGKKGNRCNFLMPCSHSTHLAQLL